MKNRTMSRRPASLKQKRRSFFSWLRPERAEHSTARKLGFESLEDRRVMAVTLGANFETSRLFVDSGFIPPDTMAAIGPNHVVEMINGNFQIFDRAGASLESRSLDSFWTTRAGATIPSGTFDPRVVFDTASSRWFATSINGGGGNTIFIARSDTSDPTGDWDSVQFVGDTINGVRFCDYDTLGLDADGLYIATNNFGGPSGFDVSLFSIPKADLLAAVPTLANMTRFEAQSSASRGASIQGNLDFGPSDGSASVIGDVGGTLRRSTINGPAAGGATLGASSAVAGVPAFSAAPAARQPSGVTIENVSPRLTGNMVKQGNFLWAVQAVQGTAGTNSAVRWYQINEATNTVVQTGLIEDTATPRDFFDPSIAVNQFGVVAIGYTSSGPTQFAGATVSVGTTINGIGGPVTTFAAPLIVQPGAGNYFQDFGSGRNRWGDYSATNVDPANAMSFWTFQEYVAVTNIWGIRATEFNVNSLDLVVSGDGGNNNFLVRRDASGLNVEIIVDGNVTTYPIGSINTITANGLGGSDTLTVDFVNGNPSPIGGIFYDGGTEAGTDLLALRNGSFTTEVSSATGGGSGTIAFSGGALGTANITYAALEPVDDTVAVVNYTFNATAAGEIINIVNGPILAGPTQTTQINSGSATFELQNIANKTNVTVNTVGGADTVRVNVTTGSAAVGLSTLLVNGTAATETYNVQATPSGVTTTLQGNTGGDIINVSSNAPTNTGDLNSLDGLLVIGSSNPSTLNISESGIAVADTVTIDTGVGPSYLISGTTGGGWSISALSTGLTYNIDLGSAGDTVNMSSSFSGEVYATVNGNGGNDIFNVTGSGLGAPSTTNLFGNAGDDVFNVNAPVTATAILNIDGGPHVLGDALNIDAGGANVIQNGNAQFVIGGPINYVNIENILLTNLNRLTVNGGGGNNQLVLTRILANRFRSLLDGGPAVLFDRPISNRFDFNGEAGDDTFTIDNGSFSDLVNLITGYIGGLNSPVGTEGAGPPGDTLVITGQETDGGIVARETYLVGASQDAGVWILDPDGNRGPGATGGGNGDELIVSFSGLEPVDTDTPAAVFDVIMPGGAGTNDDLTIDNVGSPLNGFAAVRVLDNAGTFETFRFARKDTTRIMANLNNAGGNDIFRLNYTTAPATASGGAFTLETYGHIAPGVLGQPADDNGADLFGIFGTPAGTNNSLFGQGGTDLFNNFGGLSPGGPGLASNLDNVQGTVNIDGGTTVGDNDLITLSDFFAPAADSVTLTLNQITGFAPATINYVNAERVSLDSTGLADNWDILSTNAGTDYEIGADGGNDTFTIGNTTANFNANVFTGNLVPIAGRVLIVPEEGAVGVDTLNVDDSGSLVALPAASISNIGAIVYSLAPFSGFTTAGPATRLAGFAPANIDYFHDATAGGHMTSAGNRLEFLNVRASRGNDVINVIDTTATNTTRVDGREGDDTVTVNGTNLSAFNQFQGFQGNDQFILNINGAGNSLGSNAFAPITGVAFLGEANLGAAAGDTVNRDRLTINDNSGVGRALDYVYFQTQGNLNVRTNPGFPNNGLFGANLPNGTLSVRTMETLIFNDAGDNNDRVRVFGAADNGAIGGANPENDILTAALLANNTSAFVYRNGAPYLGTAPVTIANSRPGIAGGGISTDMLLRGLSPALGLTLDGNGIPAGGGDRAVVYAASENNLVDVGNPTNIFGLGAGVLQPGFGAGNAYDTINVTDTTVTTVNNTFGPLTTVNVNTASFVQGPAPSPSQQSALIVDGGDEAGVQASGIADNFTVTVSTNFNIQTNGNLPGLSKVNGVPQGDQLNINFAGSINVFSDGASPPNVTLTGQTANGGSPFGVKFSSIERVNLASGNGVVNLIGDNNDPAVTQNDYFRVRGEYDVLNGPPGPFGNNGANQFSLEIGGSWDPATGNVGTPPSGGLSSPIYFSGVTRINVSGGEATGWDIHGNAIPQVANTGIDALDITAYADNTPLGWGIETYFNEGDPVGDGGLGNPGVDLLIYNGVLGVSEDIVIQPSTAQGGQVYSNNNATNTPIAVVNYTLNTNIIVNGSSPAGTAGDTDNLYLYGTDPANGGTSGNEDVVANFQAIGDGANPMVRVYDAGAGAALSGRPTAAELADTAGTAANIMYNLQNFTNFNTIHLDMLGGNDVVDVIAGRAGGSLGMDILGGLGADTLVVDSTNGPVLGQINFDGGAGINALVLRGGTALSDVYTPGPEVGSGTNTLTFAGGTERVNFQNLSPIFDLVAGPLTVNGTNAANAINYKVGFNNLTNYLAGTTSATWGEVSVDGFEPLEFINKTTLTINAGAGSDTINLNNPNAPTGLTGITVNGGDPTGSDTLVVNGIAAAKDQLVVAPSAAGSGTITESASADAAAQAAFVAVTFNTVEHLTLVGQSADLDQVSQQGTAANDTHEVSPGATPDSGTINGFTTGATPYSFVPISYQGFLGLVVTPFDGGGLDTVIVNGTSADDTFSFASTSPPGSVGGPFQTVQLTSGTKVYTPIIYASGVVSQVILRGLEGNDTFNVNLNPTTGNTGVAIRVEGGDSDQFTDALNYTAPAGAATTINLATSTITSAGPAGNPVTYSGVERINETSTGAGSTLTISGTAGADSIVYSPADATSGTVTANGQPTINFTGVGSTFTIDPAGGSDNLTVNGTQSGETITVTSTLVTVGALKPVTYSSANTENLRIFAQAGNDTIDVTGSATTTIFVDGGDPIGSNAGDAIVLHPVGVFTVEPGPENDEGGLNDSAVRRVSWDHIEAVTLIGGPGVGPALVLGTNGDDDLTIIARDSSTHAGTNGVQDFTVSVNDGLDVLFINVPVLLVDALAGDDDIVVREPAPNNAVWNVQIFVAGGTPASPTGDQGDVVELETPGNQTVTFSPSPAAFVIPPLPAGIGLTVPAPGGIDTAIFSDATNTSSISITPFQLTLAAVPIFNSSPGGAEQAVYAGVGGTDTLVYNSPANANAGSALTYAPGATPSSGSVTGSQIGGNALMPLAFSGLGNAGTVTFTTANAARADHLIVQDLLGGIGDVFTVVPGVAGGVGGGSVGAVQIAHTPPNNALVTLNMTTPGVSILELQGLGGIDTFKVSGLVGGQTLPYTNLIINADATVNLVAAAGAVTVTLGDNTPGSANPDTVITGYGAPVTLIGVDTANLDATNNQVTATGTTQNDNIVFTPTGPVAGTFFNDVESGNNLVPNTVFNIANVNGNFRVFNDPSGNADQVTLRGTAARDLIEINQGSGVATVLANNVTSLLPVQLGISVEILNALGLRGQDTFQVIPAPGIGGQAQDNLLINLDGGSAGENNALVVGSSFGAAPGVLAANQFVVVNKSPAVGSGTVRVFTAAVANPDINYQNIVVISPNVAGTDLNPNLLVMGADLNEPNEQQGNAAFLGAGATLQVQHATIFPSNTEFPGAPADRDVYRVVADKTGTLDFQVYFRTFDPALLPAGGQLNLQALDAGGNVIATASGGAATFGADPGTGNARIRIPAVAGQSYWLRVFGANIPGGTANAAVVNGYDMTVINTPSVIPTDIEIDDVIAASSVTAAPTATSFTAGAATLSSIAGYYVGKFVNFTSGPLSGQRGLVVTYNGAGGFTFAANSFTGAPVIGNTFQVESNDTGRSQLDNITRDNTPTLYFRLDDGIFLNDLPGNAATDTPPAGVIPIPFRAGPAQPNLPGYAIAIFDEGPTPLQGGTASQVPLGFATQISAGLYTFTTPVLSDGTHFLTARVQMIDPATPLQTGFGGRSVALEVIVDTAAPPVFFGLPNVVNDGLDPSTDSGIGFNQPTLVDRITNFTQPKFFGQAEADTFIRLFVDAPQAGFPTGNGILEPGIDFQIGATTAIPLDGTNQYPSGYWEATSNFNLNAAPFALDGLRRIFVTAEDVAGNINPPGGAGAVVETLLLFIDTQGPQVFDPDGAGPLSGVHILDNPATAVNEANYDLFDPKPSTDGPTPLVNSIVIEFRDLPLRVAQFLNNLALKPELAVAPGNYQVKGDYNGIIPIQSITVVNDPPVAGQQATGRVTLTFSKPLPDDRFTLTVSDNLTDWAGNHLDGESNSSEPQENPTFPSGDGVPGGNYVARFTVDSRPEVGTWGAGSAWIDTNGNTTFDQNNLDFTNRDITYYMGYTSDNLFAGNFFGDRGVDGILGTADDTFGPNGVPGGGDDTKADGFDKLAAYGRVGNVWRFLVDVNNDGAITPGVDIAKPQSNGGVNGIPVAGNFDGNPLNGDEVGVFTGTQWYLDTDHDFDLTDPGGFVVVNSAQNGYPVVGNFDGVAGDDLAVYRDNTFYLDFGRNGTIDQRFRFGFPTPNNVPVSADMDRDGNDDLGLFVPNRAGVSPNSDAEWYILVSGGAPIINRIHPDPIDFVNVIDYTPVPFGNDLFIQYGDEFGQPILGNFDPPVTPAGTVIPAVSYPSNNPHDGLDVNNDGLVTSIDALLIINELARNGSRTLSTSGFHTAPFIDTDKDNWVSAHDALLVINKLSAMTTSLLGGEGEGEGEVFAPAAAHDAVFSQLGGTLAPVSSEADAGILSLLADDQVRVKQSRAAK